MSQQRISNDTWDPATMLRKALAGRYPSAYPKSEHRAAEIAFWRGRCEAAGVDWRPIVKAHEARKGRR